MFFNQYYSTTYYLQFLLRNISILTVSEVSCVLFLLTMEPAKLKILSDKTEEAGIHRYFLARTETWGYYTLLCHHFNGH